MQKHVLAENISYIECSDNPLSADIGLIETGSGKWLFDVGNNPDLLNELPDKANIVISHFHADHMGNMAGIKSDNIYLSKFSYDHLKRGIIIKDDIYIENLHIFLLPSSHAKGCVCLEVDEKYTFVGDALYCKRDKDYLIYNSQLLKEEINKLKSLKSQYLLVSHHSGLIRNKDEVIAELEEIYSKHEKDSSEIRIHS